VKDSKTKTATIALVLLMALSTLMIALPVDAQENHGGEPGTSVWGPLPVGVVPDVTVITYAYLSVRPNPIGIGQTALINIWTTPSASDSVYASNYKVTFTAPDGTVDTRTMNSYYADRTAWFEYVFDQVGTWKLQLDYPGDYYPPGEYGVGVQGSSPTNVTLSRWYKPSTSPVTELVVQSEMVPSWPPAPLPTNEYWTRPVSVMNREWWPILGNYPTVVSGEGYPYWPADTNYYSGTQASRYGYQPYVTAPNTCHIVWRRQDQISGLIGGPAGYKSFASVASVPGLIYAGRCYQTLTVPINGVPTSCATCYDLRTGEYYYQIPTSEGGVTPTMISYTSSGNSEVPGAEAMLSYTITLMSLSGTTLTKVNPITGANTTITGVMSGAWMDPFVISIQNLGNSVPVEERYRWINWTTTGNSNNFASRIMENKSYASSSLGTNIDWETGLSGSISTINPSPQAPIGCRILGYNLWTGELISNFTDDYVPYQTGTATVDHGKLACLMQNGYVVAYDLRAGTRAWVSEQTYGAGEGGGYPWGIWGSYASASYGGNYFVFLYDGIYAFNWTTGRISWVYKSPSTAFETPYSGWTPFDTFRLGVLIADGKMYQTNAEHTPSQPLNRDYGLHCINITTGEGIWKLHTPTVWSGGTSETCADGYLTVAAQDGYMYVLGRGISATEVTATDTTVPLGTAVLIKGTVRDQSPGNPGVACVSDESQATYMDYLYMQQPIDGIFHNETVLGVPVRLIAIDSSNNIIEIGTVTSDVSGHFESAWTPTAEGVYKITATFEGSESYGTSWDETAVSIGPATPPIEIPPTTEPVDYSMTLYAVLVAVIIAIILAVVAIILIFRKK
jgi:hypothetical protein